MESLAARMVSLLNPSSADDQWLGIRIRRPKLSVECWVSKTKSTQHLVEVLLHASEKV